VLRNHTHTTQTQIHTYDTHTHRQKTHTSTYTHTHTYRRRNSAENAVVGAKHGLFTGDTPPVEHVLLAEALDELELG
jgi:hypothetical protein